MHCNYASVLAVAALISQASAHGVVTSITGSNGVTMPGLSVVDGTPRDCASPGCGAEADTSIIKKNGAPLGKTEAGGNVDAATAIAKFMGAGAAATTGNATAAAPAARDLSSTLNAKRGFLSALKGAAGGGAAAGGAAGGGGLLAALKGAAGGGAAAGGAGGGAAGGAAGGGGLLAALKGAAGGTAAVATTGNATANAKRGLLSALTGGGGGAAAAGSASLATGTKTPAGTTENGVAAAAGQGAASGLPTVGADGVVTMNFHQVNQDGAGPLTAAIDPTSGGADAAAFQPATMVADVPGIGIGGLSGTTTTDFPIKVQMPAGMTCTGTAGGATGVCVVKVQNAALAGPFGGSAAFTQSPAAKKRALEYNAMKKRHISRGLLGSS